MVLQYLKPQTNDVVATVVEERPYTYVEQMPAFEGGKQAFMKFMAENRTKCCRRNLVYS